MLSAWYPLTMASEARPAGTSSCLLSGLPNRALTAQAPAAALAALLPMPLPRGSPCIASTLLITCSTCPMPTGTSCTARFMRATYSSPCLKHLL